MTGPTVGAPDDTWGHLERAGLTQRLRFLPFPDRSLHSGFCDRKCVEWARAQEDPDSPQLTRFAPVWDVEVSPLGPRPRGARTAGPVAASRPHPVVPDFESGGSSPCCKRFPWVLVLSRSRCGCFYVKIGRDSTVKLPPPASSLVLWLFRLCDQEDGDGLSRPSLVCCLQPSLQRLLNGVTLRR